jgi:uncharacterized membrane protein YheB (UPF0754 family)
MNYWFFLIPLIAAALGWLGIWIAGKVLIQRIIPSKKNEIAEKIGEIVSSEFSFATIEKKITDPANVKKIMPLVENHIDDFLRNKLKQKMPVVGLLIGDKTINSLKEIFLKEIEDLFPKVLTQFAGNFQNEFDIKGMVSDKITAVSSTQLEKIFSPLLRYFCFAGALTGLIIGAINILIFFII